jgi:hypothetical protein
LENNPYAPPRALVEDPPAVGEDLARPTLVTASLNMLWATLVLGIVGLIAKWATGQMAHVSVVALIVVVAVTMAWQVWLTLKIGARRNWARMTYIVMWIGGILFLFIRPELVFHSDRLNESVFVLQTVLQVTACALLLSPSANRWFKSANV